MDQQGRALDEAELDRFAAFFRAAMDHAGVRVDDAALFCFAVLEALQRWGDHMAELERGA